MKEKSTAGRKPIPDKEKKVAVTIYVKAKHWVNAKKELTVIEKKYNAIP